jgi:hypothetical protein
MIIKYKFFYSYFFLLATMVFITSCQLSNKKLRLLKSKTVIENPYEIQALEPETPNTDESNDQESAKKSNEASSGDFHSSGPTVVSTPEIGNQNIDKNIPVNPKNAKGVPKDKITSGQSAAKTQAAINKAALAAKALEQESEDLAKQYPFKVGERIEYTVKYFAVEAGRFTFEIKKPKKIQGRPVFHFYVSARTSNVFAWVYTLKDFAESFWDMKFHSPYLMKIYGEESRYIREVQTAFDWKKKEARYQAKIMEVGKGLDEEDKTWSLNNPEAQDVVSALYFLRTKNLEVGKTFEFHVAERGKDIFVKAKVVKEVEISTKLGKMMTYMVQPTFSVDGDWKQKGDITIWLTKDQYRTPVQFEAKIKVGTIRGRLYSLKNE